MLLTGGWVDGRGGEDKDGERSGTLTGLDRHDGINRVY
jgi:hypothetical protein